MCVDSQRLEHGEALETYAVVFTVHHVLPTLTAVRGAGRVRDQLHKTGGESEAQDGEETPLRSHEDEKRGRLGSEQRKQDPGKELICQRHRVPQAWVI